MSKVEIGAKDLRAICERAADIEAALRLCLDWADKSEAICLPLQAKVERLKAEKERLEALCCEFIWAEDDPKEWESQQATIDRLEDENKALRAALQDSPTATGATLPGSRKPHDI